MDGVFEVDIARFVHAHLVVVDGGVVLVDTGVRSGPAAIAKALAETRRTVGEITAILVTHRHADHVGGLARLRRDSGAPVVAHRLDAAAIAGIAPQRLTRLQRILSVIQPRTEPAPVDEILATDGPFSVPGFTALHTPGHTEGHVSYLLERDGGVLFAGDAVAGGTHGPHRTPRLMTVDAERAEASLHRLAGLDFAVATFGHGQPVTHRAVQSFRELVRS